MLQRVLTKCTKFCSRRLSTTANLSREYFAEKLATRNLVRVDGAEVVPFLQGLMTNDMEHLKRGAHSMYTMFLNKAGRVLYDSIVYRTSEENTFLIECDSSVISEVTKHLKLFRVRRKIHIDPMVSDYTVWTVFKPYDRTTSTIDDHKAKECPLIVDSLSKSSKKDPAVRTDDIIICADPRVKLLGTRLVVPQSLQLPDIQKLLPEVKLIESSAMNDYQVLRYQLGIAEGVNELFTAKSFPLEVNCDYLHGVSFHKGCYLGQELTARTYHTGVVRKRILPIEFATHVDEKESLENVLLPNGNSAGKIRGFKGKWGVGLLRVEQVMGDSISLMATNLKCSAVRPIWWPQELPTKAELKEQQK